VGAYSSAIGVLAGIREDLDFGFHISKAGMLFNAWPDYYSALAKIDAEIWPKTPGVPPAAVFALSRSGECRWYLHVPSASLLMPAEEPELEPWAAEELEDIVARVLANQSEYFLHGTDWFTYGFFDLPVTLSEGACRCQIQLFSCSPTICHRTGLTSWSAKVGQAGTRLGGPGVSWSTLDCSTRCRPRDAARVLRQHRARA
jgi:hypothetical protein